MKALNWTWKDEDGNRTIPDLDELKSVAKFCLKEAYKRKGNFAMGGFEADEEEGALELRFIVDRVNILPLLFNDTNKTKKKDDESIIRKSYKKTV